jgi:serpin B
MKRFVSLLVVVAVIAAACGGDDGTGTTSTAPATTVPTTPTTTVTTPPGTVPFVSGELVKLDLPRATPDVADTDVTAVVRGDAALGLDLLVAVAGDDNVMVSPYSIATALSMLYPGARGATAEEMAAVMHLEVPDETLHAVRNYLDVALATTPPPMGDEDTREPFAIRPANAAWGQGGYPFLEGYLTVLAEDYAAGLRLVDFSADPGGATDTINAWVEDATEDRIRDLIPPGVIDPLTRLVLVNAIWFKANWAEIFDPESTAPGTFTRLDGSTVTVPLMHDNRRAGYATTDRYEALRLPYAGDAAMVIMLPTSGSPTELAAALAPEDLEIAWEDFQVEITLPPFRFESEIALKEALRSLGMKAAFVPPAPGDDATADLTGITASRELFVQDALHKSFIALDENGTEAAAATAIVVGLTSAPPPATFTADRPFLFWIEHASTGELLFLGQVTDPAA